MGIQEACEVMDDFLERDTKEHLLNTEEFNALNKILLECSVKLGYQVKA
ncbi:hypothetical protein [Virgibacillus litoralis]|uniref:Regulator of RNase E activity RraB n=1 Tax=Virgibacillus litoralis TaxID=578221 RepID=A0ABS4HH99_9BACI|nr:hypothetical protein [Virgibacillus litoralis]MBP1950300.1 regulator of RNase E activity RraB [Virgibacillus litoralis]